MNEWAMGRSGHLLLIALAVSGASCAPSTSGPSAVTAAAGTFVGEAQGSAAFIALSTDGERVRGYVCDGDGAQARVSRWLDASLRSDELNVTSGNIRVRATIAGTKASGTVVNIQDGTSNTFTLTKATGSAGLFRAEGVATNGASFVAGWIILTDGRQKGAVEVAGSGVRVAPSIRGVGSLRDAFLGTLEIIAILIG
jgi:hypothetical protein